MRAMLSTEQDIEVIDESQNEGTFSRFEAVSPDAVILALKPPIANGLKLARKIRRHSPRVPVILLGDTEDDELLFQGIKVGAAAYLTNEATTREELVDVIRRTFLGEYLINESLLTNPQVASRVFKFFQHLPQYGTETEYLLAPLSPREIEILNFIAQGNSNKHIAHILGISERTVKNYISSILRKLVANDRTHAVVIAWRQGLIKID
jgi:DNA-binding NarL/FixJ family response regulator